MNQARFIPTLCAFIALAAGGSLLRAECLPISGDPVSELAILDETMSDFMCGHSIDAGLLAVMKDGEIIYRRGFGWQDRARTIELPPDAMMRIASVTKPLTAAMTRKLAASGEYSLTDRAFSLGHPGAGLLEITPWVTLGDPRLAKVTASHLLFHRGGWNRSIAGDITFQEVEVACSHRVHPPPSRLQTAEWMLGRPLQFTPGTRAVYSNVGYYFLGLLVEEYAGMDAVDYLNSAILAPLGVEVGEILIGNTFVTDQSPREPFYDDPALVQSVFERFIFSCFQRRNLVERPHGGWVQENRVGGGGFIASTLPLLHFIEKYYVGGSLIGTPRSPRLNIRYNFTGSLPGTNTLVRQRGLEELHYVVLFNKRPAFGISYASQIRSTLDGLFDRLAPSYTCDGFDEPFETTLDIPERSRRVIPIKIRLTEQTTATDGSLIEAPITDVNIAGEPPRIRVLTAPPGEVRTDITSSLVLPGHREADPSFKYDHSEEAWVYHLPSAAMPAGPYQIYVRSGEWPAYEVVPTCRRSVSRK